VLRLQEDKSLAGKDQTTLSDVLGGVSPDYAVVAQKYANDSLLACNNVAFEHEYGLTLDVLTGKFDQQALQAVERAASAEAQAQQASDRAANAEAQAHQAIERAASAEVQAQQASERAVNAAFALAAVHNSSSWRITAPLRMGSRVISAFSQGPKALKLSIKTKARWLLAHASLYINRRPKLKHAALGVLARFPTLKARLKVAMTNRSFAETTMPTGSTLFANLTPRARQIHADLKAAIVRLHKESI
jgi:O-antigen chain-terminating methyltransferase